MLSGPAVLIHKRGNRLFHLLLQAEDSIRDIGVTGVQTCALPISAPADVARRKAASWGYPDSATRARSPLRRPCCRSVADVGTVRKCVVLGKSVVLGGLRLIKK